MLLSYFPSYCLFLRSNWHKIFPPCVYMVCVFVFICSTENQTQKHFSTELHPQAFLLFERASFWVTEAGLKTCDPPSASVSQVARIIRVHHHILFICFYLSLLRICWSWGQVIFLYYLPVVFYTTVTVILASVSIRHICLEFHHSALN